MQKVCIKYTFRFFLMLEKITIFDFEYGHCPSLFTTYLFIYLMVHIIHDMTQFYQEHNATNSQQ